jgi:hypothetical protein
MRTSLGPWRTCRALLHASASYHCISERGSPARRIYDGVPGGLEGMVKSCRRIPAAQGQWSVRERGRHRALAPIAQSRAASEIRAHRRPLISEAYLYL